jgi:hypothetical protein
MPNNNFIFFTLLLSINILVSISVLFVVLTKPQPQYLPTAYNRVPAAVSEEVRFSQEGVPNLDDAVNELNFEVEVETARNVVSTDEDGNEILLREDI